MADQHTIHAYCERLSTPPADLLVALERATHLYTLSPQMLSGRLQGQFLRMLSLLMRPERILEVGTFTGYSALCLAEGMSLVGELHTIEVNDELRPVIQKFFDQSGRAAQLHLHIGDAADIIPTLEGLFDIVLLDAGKLDYPLHYALALPKLRAGGILLADNVLWDGKVPQNHPDQTAQTLLRFNQMVLDDPSMESIILPLRDGLLMARKKA